jgi:hypothetical protein
MVRVRSPNYPAFGLSEAVAKTKAVYDAQHRTAEPRDVVLKHMGYGGSNGRSLKALSALTKYKLLEEAPDNTLRVSDLAINILYPESGEGRSRALAEAAMAPALWREIRNRWHDVKPTKESLEAYLVRRGFNSAAIEPIAQSYSEIFDLVSGVSLSYDSEEDDTDPEDEDEMEDAQGMPFRGAAPQLRQAGRKLSHEVLERLARSQPFKLSLTGGEVTGVMTLRSQGEIGDLVKALEALKVLLPEKAIETENNA